MENELARKASAETGLSIVCQEVGAEDAGYMPKDRRAEGPSMWYNIAAILECKVEIGVLYAVLLFRMIFQCIVLIYPFVAERLFQK